MNGTSSDILCPEAVFFYNKNSLVSRPSTHLKIMQEEKNTPLISHDYFHHSKRMKQKTRL